MNQSPITNHQWRQGAYHVLGIGVGALLQEELGGLRGLIASSGVEGRLPVLEQSISNQLNNESSLSNRLAINKQSMSNQLNNQCAINEQSMKQ